MNIQNFNLKFNNVSFTGHKKELDKKGDENHKFYYLYDPKTYKCELEIYKFDTDENGNFSIPVKKVKTESGGTIETSVPVAVIEMESGKVELSKEYLQSITDEKGYAYRFKLTNITDTTEKANNPSYAFDNGTVIGIFSGKKDDKYNVILNNRALINKNGPMKLIMPDGFNPKVNNIGVSEALRAKTLANVKAGKSKADNVERSYADNILVRNHANKFGGTFDGIIEKLPEIKAEGIKRIVGTPYTKDSISSHKYWTENAFRVAPDFGGEKSFKDLQIELFKNGINWVADAALVNEGLGGVHISDVLRKGNESEAKNMFRTSDKINLGIIPNRTDNEFTRMKIVNAPYVMSENKELVRNSKYDEAKPTYIQYYDDRLVSKEQRESDELITTYAYNNTGNIYDITRHDDAVYPYSVEVSPSELKEKMESVLNTKGKIDFSDIETILELSDYKNFSVSEKSGAGGLEVWDGNIDIAKLNFYNANTDFSYSKNLSDSQKAELNKEAERGTLSVRDYALTSGQYWTKLTNSIQLKYLSDLLASSETKTAEGYVKFLTEAKDNNKVPEDVTLDKEIINNVIKDDYHSRILQDSDMRVTSDGEGGNDYSLEDYITKKAMDLPLETLPVNKNLLAIITSPYIAKKANTKEELGVSRFDLYSEGNENLPEKYQKVYQQADSLYADYLTPMISEILSETKNISDDFGDVSSYGKFVLSEIVPDLTKYLLVKSLAKNADIRIDKNTGDIDFSNIKEDDITMQSLGIPYNGLSNEEEAKIVIDTIKDGLSNISKNDLEDLKDVCKVRFENKTENDYKIAEMILDRTESGLGWRIDAAKDIVSMDSARANNDDIVDLWSNVIDFWTMYNQAVLKENPHAYTTAEITDMGNFLDPGWMTANKELIAEYEKKLQAGYDKETLKSELIEKLKNSIKDRKYTVDGDAERKFLEQSGITSVANYNYFFSLPPEMFLENTIENGDASKNWQPTKEENHELRGKLDGGWSGGTETHKNTFEYLNLTDNNPGFLFQSPEDGVKNSYTFIGNHDKPRALHGIALDMGLFYSDFNNDEQKKIAAKILNPNATDNEITKLMETTDYEKVSSQAISMADRLTRAFENVMKEDKANLKSVKEAIAELASGKYKGHDFDADAFGTRPFEIAIDTVFGQVEYNKRINKKNKVNADINYEEIKADVLKDIMIPAFDRFYSMYKLLNVLPGSPTDFAGDKIASTGYETKTKNYRQQNRNIIHWDWLDKEAKAEYKFIRDFNDKMNEISQLRSKPELSALNDGDTVSLVMTGNDGLKCKMQGMVRYNDKSSVIVLTNLSGASSSRYERMDRKPYNEDGAIKIILNHGANNEKQGLFHGMKEGTVFKNIRQDDKSVYKVKKNQNGEYELVKYDESGKKMKGVSIQPEDLNSLILYQVKK